MGKDSLIEKVDRVKEAIGSESDSAERVRKHREKIKELKALQCNTEVTKCNTEIEIEKEKELDKDIDIYDRFDLNKEEILKEVKKKINEELSVNVLDKRLDEIFETAKKYNANNPVEYIFTIIKNELSKRGD